MAYSNQQPLVLVELKWEPLKKSRPQERKSRLCPIEKARAFVASFLSSQKSDSPLSEVLKEKPLRHETIPSPYNRCSRELDEQKRSWTKGDTLPQRENFFEASRKVTKTSSQDTRGLIGGGCSTQKEEPVTTFYPGIKIVPRLVVETGRETMSIISSPFMKPVQEHNAATAMLEQTEEILDAIEGKSPSLAEHMHRKITHAETLEAIQVKDENLSKDLISTPSETFSQVYDGWIGGEEDWTRYEMLPQRKKFQQVNEKVVTDDREDGIVRIPCVCNENAQEDLVLYIPEVSNFILIASEEERNMRFAAPDLNVTEVKNNVNPLREGDDTWTEHHILPRRKIFNSVNEMKTAERKMKEERMKEKLKNGKMQDGKMNEEKMKEEKMKEDVHTEFRNGSERSSPCSSDATIYSDVSQFPFPSTVPILSVKKRKPKSLKSRLYVPNPIPQIKRVSVTCSPFILMKKKVLPFRSPFPNQCLTYTLVLPSPVYMASIIHSLRSLLSTLLNKYDLFRDWFRVLAVP